MIKEERNKKYSGWTAEKLVDKIDEKIVELKNIKRLNRDTVKEVKNNIPLMMSNLYFRMKLLADFIQSEGAVCTASLYYPAAHSFTDNR